MIRSVLILVLFAFVPCTSLAQEKPRDEKPEISLLADFGFSGKIPTGRFAPVRVWVQAADEHISGVVELEYSSQFGESGRIVAPVDVAAGTSTSVSMVVPMPEWCNKVGLTLRSQSGSRLAETEYSTSPGATAIRLPAMLSSSEEILLSLTHRINAAQIAGRFVSASVGWQSTLSKQMRMPDENRVDLDEHMQRLDVMSRTVGVTAIMEQLPLSMAGYEGVLAVLADGSSVRGADPRAILAIQRWVLGGGRLVVLADQPGGAWRQLLPPGVPVEAIDISSPIEMPTPGEIESSAERGVFPRVRCRPMSLSLVAQELGWRERWSAEDGSLIVEGPAGLGWVTVVSVDPESVGAGEETWKLWIDVLTPAIDAIASHDSEPRTLHNAPGWRYRMALGRAMPGVVFDAIGSSTTIGPAAIVLVAIVTVSLAITLGPVDFFLLRALKRRHLAWLSALVWIALASGVAIVAPSKLRAGPSIASRLVVVDALTPNRALGEGSPHPGQRAMLALPIELRGWNLGLTYFFAGSSDSFVLEEAKGNWFEYVGSMQESVIPRQTSFLQSAQSGGIEAVRRSAPRHIMPGIWSIGTYVDAGPGAPELGVALEESQEGWVLQLEGLGAGSRLITGVLRVQDRSTRLGERHHLRQEGESLRIVFAPDLSLTERSRQWGDPFAVDNDRPYTQAWMYAEGIDELMPSALLALPGPRERIEAIEAYLSTGSYALVSLMVTDQAMDLSITAEEVEQTRSTVYRLLVPIERGTARD